MTKRRRWTLLIGAGIAGLILVAAVGGARRRMQLVWLHAVGVIPDMTWGDVMVMLPPRSGYSVEGLLTARSPYTGIHNPYNDSTQASLGRDAFRSACAPCHGLEAPGTAGPNLTTGYFRHGASDWALYRVITRGVPGTAMQAHALPRKTTWAIIAYLRSVTRADGSNLQGIPALPDPTIAALESRAVTTPGQNPAGAQAEAEITSVALRDSDAHAGEWLTYSGSLKGQRHSSLSGINRGNIDRIQPKWVFPLPVPGGYAKVESSPLVVGHSMYVTGPDGGVYALDTRTGVLIWSYTSRTLPSDLKLCCGTVNRGLAVFGTTLYLGTLDAHLIALDARTGLVRWDQKVADYRDGYSITGAPRAADGRVVVGVAGGEMGIRGFLDAYDADDGHRLWRFFTIPGPGDPGHETWGAGDSWKSGGGPTWMTGTFDPESHLLFWGVGNPGPDYQGDVRPGDNLYTNSVLAIELVSGQLRWHFQFTPHGEHDFDATEIPVLADAVVDGRPRKLLLQANRNGFYYVLDRETGAFITARPFVRQTWAQGLDSVGRPLVRPEARPSARGSLSYPSDAGGTNWYSPSYDPDTKAFYVQAREGAGLFFNRPDPKHDAEGWFMGSDGESPTSLLDYMAVRALDGTTGEMLWEYREELGSEKAISGIGGLLSTAGGLVFGGINHTFFALDARTGAELWQIGTGSEIWAAPIAYLADGTEQITVAAGSRIITFSVDGR